VAINRAPFNALVDDNGSGLTGSIWNKAAIASVLLDPIDQIGVWQNTPFNAADYTAPAGMGFAVGPGNVVFNRYTVIGKTLFWLVYIEAAGTSGTATGQLFVRLPAGMTCVPKRGVVATTQLYDGGTNRGWVRAYTDGLNVVIEKDPLTNYAMGIIYVQFSITLEIN
jgi:hypothetical protein